MAELSREEKIALANQLRTEISSLRLQNEHDVIAAADGGHDTALDEELRRLEAEREAELNRSKEIGGGNVSDAVAAMEAAAEADKPVETPVETPVEKAAVVTEAQAAALTPDLTAVPLVDTRPVETKTEAVTKKNDARGGK